MRRAIVITLLIAGLLSCGKKAAEVAPTAPQAVLNAATAQAPAAAASKQAGLSIAPEKAFVGTIIKPSATGFDIAKAGISWLINGNPAPVFDPMGFVPSRDGAKKGDTVSAIAVFDGKEYRSNSVTIQNSAPEFTKITLMPVDMKPGETLWVDAEASDPDGDPVTIEYEWHIGTALVSTTKRLPSEFNKRGTSFTVTVTPTDGSLRGQSVGLRRGIGNIPPQLEQNYGFEFDGKVLTYQIRATDPDGDPITYGVESPQPGMIVNSATGALRWDVPEGLTNSTTPIVVTASDGRGGTARMELKFSLKTEMINAPAK